MKCLKYRIGRSEKGMKGVIHDKAYKEIASAEQHALAQSPKVKLVSKN